MDAETKQPEEKFFDEMGCLEDTFNAINQDINDIDWRSGQIENELGDLTKDFGLGCNKDAQDFIKNASEYAKSIRIQIGLLSLISDKLYNVVHETIMDRFDVKKDPREADLDQTNV